MNKPGFIVTQGAKPLLEWSPGNVSLTCDGNSLTNQNEYTPAYPLLMLDMSPVTDAAIQRVIDVGYPGDTAAMMKSKRGRVTSAYDPTVKHNVLVAWELTNSIFYGETPAQAVDDLIDYVRTVKSENNWKVAVVTSIPRGAGKNNQSATQSNIDQYNADLLTANNMLKARWSEAADLLIDIREDGSPFAFQTFQIGQFVASRLYVPDNIHCTPYGYSVVAQIVAKHLTKMPA